jgi:hypothetical protein
VATLSKLSRRLACALFALAGAIYCLGASADSVAGVAKASVEAGHSGVMLKVIAAFDVIDDALDHLPGKASGEAQQQHQAVPLSPAPGGAVTPRHVASACEWLTDPDGHADLSAPEGLERPPRA